MLDGSRLIWVSHTTLAQLFAVSENNSGLFPGVTETLGANNGAIFQDKEDDILKAGYVHGGAGELAAVAGLLCQHP
jgi:hypothetical protein